MRPTLLFITSFSCQLSHSCYSILKLLQITSNSEQGRVVLAQDSHSRHVVIKLVSSDSDELNILRFLHKEPRLLDSEKYQCIVPVLELLPFDGHWFVIMPRFVVFCYKPDRTLTHFPPMRWGPAHFLSRFQKTSEILDAISSFLTVSIPILIVLSLIFCRASLFFINIVSFIV